jgi:aconitate hydratase 2/2-methylisocitrate dehydratase
MEMPGCSLCMGNQAQIREGATAMSTSTRNFPNRLGIEHQRLPGLGRTGRDLLAPGRIPTREEYMADIGVVNANGERSTAT